MGIIWKADLMLVFAMKQPRPMHLIDLEASLIDAYRTVAQQSAMKQQQQHFIHSCTAYIHLNMEKRTKLTYNY